MAIASETRAILESLNEPGLLIAGNRVRLANRAATDLFGRALEGADVRLAIRHPEALELILGKRVGDVEITGIGGAGRPWLLSIRPAGNGQMLVRLTDRSAMRASERMRVDFVANASHELRTPLTTIIGYAETLSDDDDLDTATHARFAGIIRSEAKRMLQIVEDLMSLSRIEADRFIPAREEIHVPELLTIAAANAAPLCESRQCSVEVEVEDDLPTVRGDFAQLLQLVDNLVSNAVRYGCRTAQCKVRIGAHKASGQVVLTVSDNGEGIAPEHLHRLTERFYRVDDARSRDSGGTGLGLAIVKHIVERHRGTLDIRSTLGKGTEVAVRLHPFA